MYTCAKSQVVILQWHEGRPCLLWLDFSSAEKGAGLLNNTEAAMCLVEKPVIGSVVGFVPYGMQYGANFAHLLHLLSLLESKSSDRCCESCQCLHMFPSMGFVPCHFLNFVLHSALLIFTCPAVVPA